jgi:hypothetical protein
VRLALRKDDRAVGDDVELALAALAGLRLETVSLQLGRETRGPFVVAASDGAVEDLDGHRPGAYPDDTTRGIGNDRPPGDSVDDETGGLLRVKLSNPGLLRGLVKEFAFDPNVVVTELADDEVEVSFLGSLNTSAQLMETELRLRAWLSAHPEAVVVMRE